MYFARASYVFKNNDWKPKAKRGSGCLRDKFLFPKSVTLYDPTIASLLNACDVSWAFYAEGYNEAETSDFTDCFPKYYDSSDVPFQYYDGIMDDPLYANVFV